MAKMQLIVSVDPEVLRNAKELVGYGHLSKTINDYLKSLIDMKKEDVDAISIKLLEKERDMLLPKMTKIKQQIEGINQKLENYKEIHEKKQLEELKKQEEESIMKCTCMNCNEVFSEENLVRPTRDIVICKECWRINGIVKEVERKRYKNETANIH